MGKKVAHKVFLKVKKGLGGKKKKKRKPEEEKKSTGRGGGGLLRGGKWFITPSMSNIGKKQGKKTQREGRGENLKITNRVLFWKRGNPSHDSPT